MFIHLPSKLTPWRCWLRHCAISRKVADSIPDGVTGIFHSHNLSGRTMALELTQPLIEMSKGKGKGKGRPFTGLEGLEGEWRYSSTLS
jgi:hypothetical protein